MFIGIFIGFEKLLNFKLSNKARDFGRGLCSFKEVLGNK